MFVFEGRDSVAPAGAPFDSFGEIAADFRFSPVSIVVFPQCGWAGCRGGGECRSGGGEDVWVDEFCERDWLVAVGAVAADADAVHEGAAVLAALFAEGSVVAGVALVDGDGSAGYGFNFRSKLSGQQTR